MAVRRRGPAAKTRLRRGRAKVAAHRARLRAQGLRPIQIWVPDLRAPGFAAEARRQSRALAAADRAHGDQDFVDAVADLGES